MKYLGTITGCGIIAVIIGGSFYLAAKQGHEMQVSYEMYWECTLEEGGLFVHTTSYFGTSTQESEKKCAEAESQAAINREDEERNHKEWCSLQSPTTMSYSDYKSCQN